MSTAFLWGHDYLALPHDPQHWLINGLVPVSGLVNIYGPPKGGKSFAALGMAIAVSTGAPSWLTFDVEKHGPVAYFQIDTPRGDWAGRLQDIATAGFDLSKIAFCDMMMPGLPYPYNVLDVGHTKWLHDQLAEVQPVLVIVDTLREVHGGDENDSTVMRNVMTNLVAACRWEGHQSALLLVSHSRKGTNTPGAGNDLMAEARGSSYIAGRMDMVIRFTATSMSYHGRSKDQGRLTIEQNDLGMVELDAEAQAYHAFMQQRVPEVVIEHPGISITGIANMLEKETSYKKSRSMRGDVEHYVQRFKLNVTKRAHKTHS